MQLGRMDQGFEPIRKLDAAGLERAEFIKLACLEVPGVFCFEVEVTHVAPNS